MQNFWKKAFSIVLQRLIPRYIQNFFRINLTNSKLIGKLENQKLLHLIGMNADLYKKLQNEKLSFFFFLHFKFISNSGYYIQNGLLYPKNYKMKNFLFFLHFKFISHLGNWPQPVYFIKYIFLIVALYSTPVILSQ